MPVPVVIVQHMPPVFTRFLAERLNALSALTIREAHGGERLSPGTVWIAPGDYHLTVRRCGPEAWLETQQGPQENSCRPSVDVLFRSVDAAYPGTALGVVLTGMGQDGLLGARILAASGSAILAQDEATSVVWGMPGYIAKAGIADRVLSPLEIAEEISSRVMHQPPGAARIKGAVALA
jgi:two-component system chemotaxis response regulator CheB